MTTNPVAERTIAKLITVLSQEMRMYNELLLVLRKKQSSIIEGKIEDLKEAVEKEQVILKETEAIARNRDAAFNKMKEILSSESEIRNLSELIQVVEATYAERLANIHRSLQQIVHEVVLTNEENRYLLTYSIKFVREAARELVKSSEQFPVYSAEGSNDKGPSSSRLIEGRI